MGNMAQGQGTDSLDETPSAEVPGESRDAPLSIILPAKNESASLRTLGPALRARFPEAEIIVVDDGSGDDTAAVARQAGLTVVSHPYSIGNGGAIKSGGRHASGRVLVFMDADGQHDPNDIPRLLEALGTGYDMVVGARDAGSQAGLHRLVANEAYNLLASWMTGHPIRDLTSGMRAVKASKFLEFLQLLPNGFSYPTTLTMAFFRSGYPVAYVPIKAARRIGKSHVRPLRDGVRFLMIIFKIGSMYSPMKIFAPIAAFFFFVGLSYYAYTFAAMGRFTNMSALLLTTSVVVFLIGLVSEQITSLLYVLEQRRRVE